MKRKTLQRLLLLTGILLLATTDIWAQNELDQNLFEPELVMEHQKAIGLTESQKTVIIQEIQTAQAEFTKWQWELRSATDELQEMIASQKVDESRTIQQLEKILELERNIKQIQMRLMIRIKNQLTRQQQEKLLALKKH
ncbi:MAG: hypothetical protein KDC44_23420 [Phaeodactylibacter sp.]|nr:hypothetical protein [Phaeodactylibacter sp.]